MKLKLSIAAITAGVMIGFAFLSTPTPVVFAEPLPTTTATTLPSMTITIGNKPIVLEIADSPDEQERGLMFRTSMPADHGMIFVFPDSQPRSFWMKNTYIPLDIVYLDAASRVLNVEQMQPLNLSGVRSAGPARYAIELNQGTAARLGIQPGDELALPVELR